MVGDEQGHRSIRKGACLRMKDYLHPVAAKLERHGWVNHEFNSGDVEATLPTTSQKARKDEASGYAGANLLRHETPLDAPARLLCTRALRFLDPRIDVRPERR